MSALTEEGACFVGGSGIATGDLGVGPKEVWPCALLPVAILSGLAPKRDGFARGAGASGGGAAAFLASNMARAARNPDALGGVTCAGDGAAASIRAADGARRPSGFATAAGCDARCPQVFVRGLANALVSCGGCFCSCSAGFGASFAGKAGADGAPSSLGSGRARMAAAGGRALLPRRPGGSGLDVAIVVRQPLCVLRSLVIYRSRNGIKYTLFHIFTVSWNSGRTVRFSTNPMRLF